jgi:hypothetical protein
MKNNNGYFIIDGNFCSHCRSEAEIEFDEDWDVAEDGSSSFVLLPYLICKNCHKRLEKEPNQDEKENLSAM